MKYAITILTLLFTVTAHGQDAESMYALFAKDVSVTLIEKDNPKTNHTRFFASTPDYVDKELLQMQVNSFVRRYSDLAIVRPWRVYKEGVVIVIGYVNEGIPLAGIRILYINGGIAFEYINLKGKNA